MTIDKRLGSRISNEYKAESAAGIRVDPYPYIGIVKNNLDPTRAGRLQVWIPDFGGDEDNPSTWTTVRYSSPFMGTTQGKDSSEANTKFSQSRQSYGFWMIPPDIGVEVIVIFIGGDPSRGYFIACTNTQYSRNMMPGLAGSPDINGELDDEELRKSLSLGVSYPVVEFSDKLDNTASLKNVLNPINEPQVKILLKQGLDQDPIRGAISSSSQRETPSNVFGINTPGRPFDDEKIKKALDDGSINATLFNEASKIRLGGHSFVMDDGDIVGNNQLLRLRTATGHQLLMHDTNGSIYLANADGNTWIELDSNGHINLFAQSGFNIRTGGDLNFHSDSNINVHANNNISMYAGNKFQVDSGELVAISKDKIAVSALGDIQISSAAYRIQSTTVSINATSGKVQIDGTIVEQNIGTIKTFDLPKQLSLYKQSGSVYDASVNRFVNKAEILNTIVSVSPSHEPWIGHNMYGSSYGTSTVAKVDTSSGNVNIFKSAGRSPVLTSTNGIRARPLASDKLLREQMKYPGKPVGNLSQDQMTAWLAGVAQSESGGSYTIQNKSGFLGKYQLGAAALQDAGYLTPHTPPWKNSDLDNPAAWSDGWSKEKFLSGNADSQDAQERAMQSYTERNYRTLKAKGVIGTDTTSEEVGGYLMAAHLNGAGGVSHAVNSGSSLDSIGDGATSAGAYYRAGSTAIQQSSSRIAALNAPPTAV